MNKYLIYTSNPDVMPKGMDDILKFAEEAHKYYFAKVKSSNLANVGKGDHIISSKGNNLYIIEALTTADTKLIESYERRGMKRMNIKDAEKVQIVPFAKWCKYAHGIAATISAELSGKSTNKTSSKMNKNSLSSLTSRLKEMYTPSEVSDVRIAQDGNICVETSKGWVTIGADGKLRAFPEEFTIGNFPMFAVCKPVSQIQPGDVLVLENSYAKVISYVAETGTIKAKSFSGSKKTLYTVEDVVFGQSTVKVLVNPAASLFGNGGINPMMLAFMNKKDGGNGFKDLLPFLMMNNGGAFGGSNNGFNPMMFALMKDGDSSFEDLLLFMSMSNQGGSNPFAGLFSGFGSNPAPAAAPEAENSND